MTPTEAVQQAESILKQYREIGPYVEFSEDEIRPCLEYLLAERKAMQETLAEHVHCHECNAIISLRGVFVALYPENKPPYFCTFECADKWLEKSGETGYSKHFINQKTDGDESRPITEEQNPS